MYIHVKIKTKQKKESIVQLGNANDNRYEISVKEEAKQNKANARMLEMIRVHFGVHQVKQVKIVSGHHSPSKLLSIEGVEAVEISEN